MKTSLDLAPVGNCSISGLIDRCGRYVWRCAPRVDSDPVFCALLSGKDPEDAGLTGVWSVELTDLVETRQEYLRNTPILRTELTDSRGNALEIIDFAPRYRQHGRVYRPTSLIRMVRPLKGVMAALQYHHKAEEGRLRK